MPLDLIDDDSVKTTENSSYTFSKPAGPSAVSKVEDESSEEEDIDIVKKAPIKLPSGMINKIAIGVAGVAGIFVVGFLIYNIFFKEEVPSIGYTNVPQQGTTASQNNTPTQEQQAVVQEDIPDSGVSLGIKDATSDTTYDNYTKPVDPSLYLKDISGLTMNAQYTVSSIETIRDFVNYRKMRGQIGVGYELLWLDVTYKEQSYVIQVPFTLYKELDNTGIIVVDMEVLHIPIVTAEGKREGSIVSSMSVVPNYKQLVEQKKK